MPERIPDIHEVQASTSNDTNASIYNDTNASTSNDTSASIYNEYNHNRQEMEMRLHMLQQMRNSAIPAHTKIPKIHRLRAFINSEEYSSSDDSSG